MNDHIRVLIVDDSAVARLMVSQVIREAPELQLVGAESSGEAALARLSELQPDVVVLDVEMPGIGGLETVGEIRSRQPLLPVIMFSSHTIEGASVTITALSKGAADFVTKPTGQQSATAAMDQIRSQLLPKIRSLGRARRRPQTSNSVVAFPPATLAKPSSSTRRVEIVCIVGSTGGPEAVSTVLAALPATLSVPVLIVLHMPPYFTKQFSEHLAGRCAIQVREARSGEPLAPGLALVAPGDFHLAVSMFGARATAVTNQDEHENSCRPAADVLLRSVAKVYGPRALAVVLTGMGQDGLKGCQAMSAVGGQIVVQDEATSVVWGMPGSVAQAGIAERILPIDRIGAEILRRVQ